MTDLLRAALLDCESWNAVEKATGVKRQSLAKFARGEQSMHLSAAEKLAVYFDIEAVQKQGRMRKAKSNETRP